MDSYFRKRNGLQRGATIGRHELGVDQTLIYLVLVSAAFSVRCGRCGGNPEFGGEKAPGIRVLVGGARQRKILHPGQSVRRHYRE